MVFFKHSTAEKVLNFVLFNFRVITQYIKQSQSKKYNLKRNVKMQQMD